VGGVLRLGFQMVLEPASQLQMANVRVGVSRQIDAHPTVNAGDFGG
jgi:hypothetical protein